MQTKTKRTTKPKHNTTPNPAAHTEVEMTKKTEEKKTPNDIATSKLTATEQALAMAPPKSEWLPPGTWSNRADLRAQAAISYDWATEYARRLTPGGWPPQKTADLQTKAEKLDAAYIASSDQREASKKATVAFWLLVDDTVVFRNQVVAGLKSATLGSKSPFKDKRLQLKQTMKVPKQLGVWLDEIQTQVKLHKAALTPLFPSDPEALTQAYAARLTAALGAQNRNRSLATDLAKAKSDARVELAAAINDLHYTAAIVFQREKAILKHFVPNWGKKGTKKKASTQPGSGETTVQPGSGQTPAQPGPAAAPAAQATAEAPASKPSPA